MEETINQYLELSNMMNQFEMSDYSCEEQAMIFIAQTELILGVDNYVRKVKPIVARKMCEKKTNDTFLLKL